MTGIEGYAVYPNASQLFTLPRTDAIARVYFATWVIREASKNLYGMTARG